MEALHHATAHPVETMAAQEQSKSVARSCSVPISSIVILVVAVILSAMFSALVGYHASANVLRPYTQTQTDVDVDMGVPEISAVVVR